MKFKYIAGFFDADGYITISAPNLGKFRSTVLGFTNSELYILESIKQFFNYYGVKSNIVHKRKREEHHKESYDLKIRYNSALLAAKLLRPYILHKKKQLRIDLVLSKYKKLTNRNGKYTEYEVQEKLKFEQEFLAIL